jgi:hypothetical protein
MPIERFIWTTHAEKRRAERLLDRSELERSVRDGHAERQRMKIPPAPADWLLAGITITGISFEAVYDHPHGSDHAAVRIVSVWDF